MEVTCPIQCTYKLTEVTVRKDLAQQSTQETLKGPQGRFRLNGDTPHRHHIFSFPLSERNSQNRTLKFDIKAKRAHAHVWPALSVRAAAQLAALLISLWLKTLHVPWKTATQSSDIDRATLRWAFLFLPVCGSGTEGGGWGQCLELTRTGQHINFKQLRSCLGVKLKCRAVF